MNIPVGIDKSSPLLTYTNDCICPDSSYGNKNENIDKIENERISVFFEQRNIDASHSTFLDLSLGIR